VRIVQFTEARTLDPGLLDNSTSFHTLVGSSLYGQLLTVDYDGQVEYGLAESLTTTDQGRTWQLKLRDGLKFSDGTPFDAQAVQFNWARLKDPSLGSSKQFANFIDTMTPSGQTLNFTLTRPIPKFENAIAEDLNWVALPSALQGDPAAFNTKPIGAGPFVLESWTRGGQMVLKRNPTYYDAPRPYLDQLVLTSNGDENQRLAALQSGAVDAAAFTSAAMLGSAEKQGFRVTTADLGGGVAFGLNTRVAPFNDVRARQAVVHGVDRNAVNAAAYRGEAQVPDTLYSTGSPYNGDTHLPAFDKALAQQLFDELAAEGKPVQFTITAYQSSENRRVAEAIQAQLRQYRNVTVEIEVLDFPAATGKIVQRTFQMAVTSVVIGNDPGPIMFRSLTTGSPGNVVGISDQQLDTALEAAMSSSDDNARAQAYQTAARRLGELATHLTYVRWQPGLVTNDKVNGVEMYARGGLRTDMLWVSP
jgi:peptide/nickel transport system substrate-binding protein